MFAMLLACTGNLVSRAVEFGKLEKLLNQFPSNTTVKKFVTTLSVALVKTVTFNHFSWVPKCAVRVTVPPAMSGNQLRNSKHVP